jgi:hypothetical protein
MTANQIIWHQLPDESPATRAIRLNKDLHRIFFDSKDVCPASFLIEDLDSADCLICGAASRYYSPDLVHSTPRFLESLDAMQLIVTSGRFAEVREEFYHWLASEGKPPYECTILLYRKQDSYTRFTARGHSRQEAFYGAALRAVGYEVVQEEQGESR